MARSWAAHQAAESAQLTPAQKKHKRGDRKFNHPIGPETGPQAGPEARPQNLEVP